MNAKSLMNAKFAKFHLSRKKERTIMSERTASEAETFEDLAKEAISGN